MKYKSINKIIFNILNLLNLNVLKEKIDLIVNDESKSLTNEEIINDLYYLLNHDICDEEKTKLF